MLKKICLILLAITVFVVILIPDKNAIPRGAQSIGGWYYKNRNDVYFETGWGFFLQLHDPYKSYRIDEADGKTFSYLGNNFAKDKNHVYLASRIIKWATPDKFKFASGSFSKYVIDDKNVWYGDEAMPLVDIETFSVIADDFAKDKNHVYFASEIIEWANPIGFEVLGHMISKDKEHVWYGSGLLQNRDPSTFKLIDYIFPHEYTKDKEHVWYNREGILWADPQTFELLRLGNKDELIYSKDKNHVYQYWKKIDIDIKTFKVVEWQTDKIRFLRDQYGIYCFENLKTGEYYKLQLNWIDLNTFELLNKEYSKDDKHVYFTNCSYQWFYSKIVEWADPKTFQIK